SALHWYASWNRESPGPCRRLSAQADKSWCPEERELSYSTEDFVRLAACDLGFPPDDLRISPRRYDWSRWIRFRSCYVRWSLVRNSNSCLRTQLCSRFRQSGRCTHGLGCGSSLPGNRKIFSTVRDHRRARPQSIF